MPVITAATLDHAIASRFWPFVRIGSCLMVAPVFGAATVPAQVRIVLAGAIALLVAPLIAVPTQIALLSAPGVLITVQQIIIGVALGFCLQLVFEAVALGGQIVANSMGLSLSYNLDPLSGESTPALGQLYTLLVTLLFLLLNGHIALIRILVEGFRTLPVGTSGLGPHAVWAVIEFSGTLFSGALAVALPAITALMVANLAFGVVSRAAPALNLFALGLPVVLVFGLVVILVSLPVVQSGFERLLAAALMFIQRLSGA
jgi:flagellar biosynthetic protein FliR